jgi:RNA polymerase sigma-70 factor (ECF subfamily)
MSHPTPASSTDSQSVPAEFRELLRRAHFKAVDEVGRFHVEEDAFLQRLWASAREALAKAAVSSPSARHVEEALETLAVGDLYLATAMSQGDPRSWALFEERYAEYARRLCHHYIESPERAREITATLAADLFLPRRDGEPARVASYRGFGSLKGWLKVVLYHITQDRYREDKKTVSLDDDSGRGEEGTSRAERIESPAPPPDADIVQKRCHEAFQAALPQAVIVLDDREKNLVQLYFVKGLQGNELAPMFRVHESTVSRWLDKLRLHLKSTIERVAHSRCGMTPRDVRECYEVLGKGLHVSLDRILEEPRKK